MGGEVDLVAVLLLQVELHLGDVEVTLGDCEQTLAVLYTKRDQKKVDNLKKKLYPSRPMIGMYILCICVKYVGRRVSCVTLLVLFFVVCHRWLFLPFFMFCVLCFQAMGRVWE